MRGERIALSAYLSRTHGIPTSMYIFEVINVVYFFSYEKKKNAAFGIIVNTA